MIKPQSQESEHQIAQMFNRISKRYDFLNRLLSAGRDRHWRDDLVSALPRVAGGRYLDVATGTGDVILMVLKDRPEFAEYTGVDIAEKMLDLARHKAEIQSATKLKFLTMSAQKLDFPDGTFDAISISFGLRNVVNKEQALGEFARVLKPGGVLLILEFFQAEGLFMQSVFQFYFHYILPVIGRIFSEKKAYEYLPASVQSFYSEKGLLNALKEHGFSASVRKNYLFGCCKLFAAQKI